MGDGMKLNIAIMKCCKGSSVLVVKNAVKVLGPRAVFAVGSCSGLDCKNVKVGDVVVLDKLITYGPSKVTENGIEELGVKVPLKPRLSKLTTAAGDGWKPPLKDTEALEVKIHRGAFLSGQEVVDSPERCHALIKRFRGAVAIEGEGEGVYAAAHDVDIEWIVIKGISNFADGRKIKGSWRTFASLMAASLTAHILSDTIVFHDFPHYGRSSKEKNREDNSGMKSCNQVRQQESDTQPSLGGVIYDALRQICKMEAKGNAGKTDPSLNLKKKANEKGFEISDNRGEGNCMFFAISEQLKLIQGVKLSHRKLRKKVVHHLKKNPTLPDGTELFHFVEGYSSWDDYLKSMKADGTWGDHLILHGAANRFDTCIHVISSQRDYRDVIIHPQCEDADRKRLVLGHVCELHYVSLIPRKGTAKRQKRRLQTDEDDAHLDWGGEKKKKHKSGAKRCKQ